MIQQFSVLYRCNWYACVFAAEIHICEDGQEFIEATEACNTMLLGDVVEVIRGRCKRLCHVVKAELKRNKDSYTQEQIHQSHGAMEKLIMKCDNFIDLYKFQ